MDIRPLFTPTDLSAAPNSSPPYKKTKHVSMDIRPLFCAMDIHQLLTVRRLKIIYKSYGGNKD